MDKAIHDSFEVFNSTDKTAIYEAYEHILKATEEKADWAYEVWDRLKAELTNADAHRRSRAAQFLSGLAISDPEKRILNDFPLIWKVTFDEKFVTARHSLQSIWKIALAGAEQKKLVLEYLADRFHSCTKEKHPAMIRSDIMESLRKLYEARTDEGIRELAMELIESETDDKQKKKLIKVWK
ncbi:hypothetical protein LRR81_12725 [Metabacillus sp. GX 13764]|uniref:hypothetical protein n=1 Tax=Metabacillus kandeliae TaxID=2900151 RepID=UPI001E5BFA5F|nr:hypothetical protein [Metabacillus kandeliae]MCD7035104.1 hypothetical protein [Metabacillus kandeliae]